MLSPEFGPKTTQTIRAKNFQPLLGPIFGTNIRPDIGPNVWPEDWPKYQLNETARIIWVTFGPKFGPEMAQRIRPEYFSTRALALTNFLSYFLGFQTFCHVRRLAWQL